VDGGRTWSSSLGDLPKGNYADGATRFSLGISHPAGASSPTLYTGFDYVDSGTWSGFVGSTARAEVAWPVKRSETWVQVTPPSALR